MRVERVSKEDWHTWADVCYPSVFNAVRPKALERIDYALLAMEEKEILTFVTVKEMDSETAYWQFGGAMAEAKKSYRAVMAYMMMIRWEMERHKRITTKIENDNISMLKVAMACGFKIQGVSGFKGKTFVELLNEFHVED